MSLRDPRERAIQTLCYETGSAAISLPFYLLLFGSGLNEGPLLFAALTLACLIWTPLHNTAFDRIDLALTGRAASDRPQHLRVLHALTHEATAVIATLPLIIWIGGFGFWDGLAADMGLTLFDAIYAYLFHLAYDHWRPVTRCKGAFAEPGCGN